MPHEITATEAARSFSKLLDRVRYGGDTFIVIRNGQVMCRIGPAGRRSTLEGLLDVLRRGSGDDSFADDLDAAHGNQPRPPGSPWES